MTAAITALGGLNACAAQPLPPSPPSPPPRSPLSSAQWRSLRSELDTLRARLVPVETRRYVISTTFEAPAFGPPMSARGAYAVQPPDALRMQLVGPAGSLALDVWMRGEASRLSVPPIGLVERQAKGETPSMGRPVGFLRWWMLHPLDGKLLFAAEARTGEHLFVLRAFDGALVEARVNGSDRVVATRTLLAAKSEERVDAERAPCGHSRYTNRYPRVVVDVRCESFVVGAPARAFADPDHPGAP